MWLVISQISLIFFDFVLSSDSTSSALHCYYDREVNKEQLPLIDHILYPNATLATKAGFHGQVQRVFDPFISTPYPFAHCGKQGCRPGSTKSAGCDGTGFEIRIDLAGSGRRILPLKTRIRKMKKVIIFCSSMWWGS